MREHPVCPPLNRQFYCLMKVHASNKDMLSSGDLIAILRKRGVRLSKRLGQHLMVDVSVLRRMIEHAKLGPGDRVLEIGAGVGNLTKLIAQSGVAKVWAVEADARLCEILRQELSGLDNVEILQADFLEVRLPQFNKVVSNLPFGISSQATFRLLEEDFELGVLTYQKEFAERLVARAGTEAYGRLTVMVWARAEVEVLEDIPPDSFYPRPKVWACLVRLRPRPPPVQPKDWGTFSRLVAALFQHRRQKVRNALLHSPSFLSGRDKGERRRMIDALPGRFLQKKVMDLTPEEIVEFSNYLSMNSSGLGTSRGSPFRFLTSVMT